MKPPQALNNKGNAEMDLLMAEHAAQLHDRMKAAGTDERAEFVRWLKQSPRHVGEVLLAMTLDRELENFDRERRIDIDGLMSQADANVAPLKPS